MTVRAAYYLDRAMIWSLWAVLAGALAAVLVGLLFTSNPGEDWSSLNWRLILLPALLVPAPFFLPNRFVRLYSAVAMGCWCVVSSFSIGFLFFPCTLLMFGAAFRGFPE